MQFSKTTDAIDDDDDDDEDEDEEVRRINDYSTQVTTLNTVHTRTILTYLLILEIQSATTHLRTSKRSCCMYVQESNSIDVKVQTIACPYRVCLVFLGVPGVPGACS
ncbi:unnamed protein product [Ambrosiozyma monospora]|uniref:Unnamed protein product n=1 Tax=Ambrosiozyma monospora TaxID=43982 RepID=A0A9W7DII7_AMBMO|nr:unnamed protein product [Ambrosiozyma monospora]